MRNVMQNGDTLIEVKDLHKSFGKHEVLKGMNMTVKALILRMNP